MIGKRHLLKSIFILCTAFAVINCSKSHVDVVPKPQQQPQPQPQPQPEPEPQPEVTKYTLFGYCTGTTTSASVVTSNAFILEANGKIVATEAAILYGNPVGIGTWLLTDTNFTATYTTNSIVTNIKATYNPVTGKLTGTIGTGTSVTNKGTLVMQLKIPAKTGDDEVIGYYVGHFSGTGNFVMLLESGGKMKSGGDVTSFYDAATSPNGFGDGTWTMVGDQVSVTYTYPKTNFTISWTGKFDATTKKITGTWGFGTKTDAGPFYLDFKN